MHKIGHEITQEDLDNIMQEHDLAKNGVITYIEFKALFLDIADLDQASKYELKNSQLEK